jgi:hypothetical protein
VHFVPLPTVPHDPLRHGFPTQSVASVQVVAHVFEPRAHMNGAHVTLGAATQLPAPSHAEPLTAIFVLESHVPAAQLVPFGQSSQWRWPSHLPSS